MHRSSLVMAFAVVVAACSQQSPADTEGTSTTSTAAAPASTSTVPELLFTPAHLPAAVLQEGDPWPTPPTGFAVEPLTLDDIWPADADFADFTDERAAYTSAGFLGGSFAFFADEDVALLITGAHLFADSEGAHRALDTVATSFDDPELLEIISGLPPGSLGAVTALDAPDLGDTSDAVIATGPESQVVGVIWVTGNLLQFVRSAMPLEDGQRAAGALAVAEAMAARLDGLLGPSS